MPNYSAVITGTALAESKLKHTPCVKISLKTLTDLDTGAETEKHFYMDLWLGDKAVMSTVQILKKIGFTGASFMDLNYSHPLNDVEVEITTEMINYCGQIQEKVKYLNPKGSKLYRQVAACSEDLAKSIAHRFDAVLRGGKPVKSIPTPPPAPLYGEEVMDSPF